MKHTINTLIKISKIEYQKQNFDEVMDINKVIFHLKNMIGENTDCIFDGYNERFADNCPWLRMWSE